MSSNAKSTIMTNDGRPALTPKLRFPEFRNAAGFQVMKLNGLLFEAKHRNRTLELGPADVLSVSGEHGCVNQIEFMGRSYAGVTVKDYHVVEHGDIVYTKSPLKKNPYGIIKANKGKRGIVSTLYAVYRPFSNCSAIYLDHFFSVDYNLNAYLQPIVKKGAKNDMKVNNADVLKGDICVPELNEQRKIADCLTSVDELIAAQARKVDTLKIHKQGLMQQLFPGEGETQPRSRFPDFQGAGEWDPHPFEDFVAKSFYWTSSSTSPTGQYPVLRMGNMADGGLDFTNLVYIDLDADSFASFRLEDGDILLNRTNSPALVGKISLFRLESECITASYIVTYRLKKQRIVPTFCNFMLNTPMYQARIKKLAKPSISQANINPTAFKKELIVSVPALPEQQRIADCLTSLDDLIAAQTQKLDALKTHKKGLMQQLFPSMEGA
jgi:type I restriction enzyme S subunit